MIIAYDLYHMTCDLWSVICDLWHLHSSSNLYYLTDYLSRMTGSHPAWTGYILSSSKLPPLYCLFGVNQIFSLGFAFLHKKHAIKKNKVDSGIKNALFYTAINFFWMFLIHRIARLSCTQIWKRYLAICLTPAYKSIFLEKQMSARLAAAVLQLLILHLKL